MTAVSFAPVRQELKRLGVSAAAINALELRGVDGEDGSNGWIPLVTGEEPPVLVSDGAGQLILIGGPL